MIDPVERDVHAHVDETQVIASLIAGTNGCMLDVGAHHGSALDPFLRSGWRVVAFEPDPTNRARLVDTYGQFPSLVVDERACTDETRGEVEFFTSDVSTGISGLSSFHESHRVTTRVQTTTLRDACEQYDVQRVDFLKVDTEGFDLFVLRGHDFERLRPRVVECEFEDAKTVPLGYDFDDLAGFLVDLGYKVFVSEWHPVVEYGRRHDWHALHEYPCELLHERAWGNLLAFDTPVDARRVGAAFVAALQTGASGGAVRSALGRLRRRLGQVRPRGGRRIARDHLDALPASGSTT